MNIERLRLEVADYTREKSLVKYNEYHLNATILELLLSIADSLAQIAKTKRKA